MNIASLLLSLLAVMIGGGLATAAAAAAIEFARAWADPERRADIRRHTWAENVARALR